MGNKKMNQSDEPDLLIKGVLEENGVRITEMSAIGELSSRGYGVKEDKGLILTLYEGLNLLDRKMLEVENEEGENVDFQSLLAVYRSVDEGGWIKYLSYRDLRSRGYVVREGFGRGIDFRVYERGTYGKNAAKHLIFSAQEGKPVAAKELSNALVQCQRLKKELVLAVINRRGEIVYYSVGEIRF